MELDLEQSDDLKLAVTEACGFLLEHAPNAEPINLDFAYADEKIRVTVGLGPHPEVAENLTVDDHDNLGLFLIHALMDEVRATNHGRTLILSKDLSRRVDE